MQEGNTKVTPGRCIVAASVSGIVATGLYWLTAAIYQTYGSLPVTSTNPIVINISMAVRTLVVGLCTLATMVFGIVALGLIALAIQLSIQSLTKKS